MYALTFTPSPVHTALIAYGNVPSKDIRFECWMPGTTPVFCFDMEGNACWPYEMMKLDYSAAPVPPSMIEKLAGKMTVTFAGQQVAKFPRVDTIMVRLYYHLPTSPDNPERIPHHVADVLVATTGDRSSLCAHADNGWVPIQSYGTLHMGSPRALVTLNETAYFKW